MSDRQYALVGAGQFDCAILLPSCFAVRL